MAEPMLSYLKIGGHDIPIKVIQEWRASTRVALGKDHVILRIPKTFFKDQIHTHLSWAARWLQDVETKKPNILLRYVHKKNYENGDVLEIGNNQFTMTIQSGAGDMARVKLGKEKTLCLHIPEGKSLDRQKVIKQLLAKFSCRYFLPFMVERVAFFNDHYFKQEFKEIRLKYNKTNWGSCSREKNLNFSVRLLLAPPGVLDYVIVHELAHLIEMNHSERFWKLVEDVMPDYKKYEKLLRINSHLYDF